MGCICSFLHNLFWRCSFCRSYWALLFLKRLFQLAPAESQYPASANSCLEEHNPC